MNIPTCCFFLFFIRTVSLIVFAFSIRHTVTQSDRFHFPIAFEMSFLKIVEMDICILYRDNHILTTHYCKFYKSNSYSNTVWRLLRREARTISTC